MRMVSSPPRRLLRPASLVLLTAVVLLAGSRAEARPGPSPTPASPATATGTQSPAASTAPSQSPPPGIQPGPGAPGTPAPGATGSPSQVNTPGSSSPGFFDIAGHIEQAIDNWFRDLVTSALNPVLALLGRTVFATPDLSGPGRVADLWGLAAGIANAALVLLVLAGGALVMSHETLQTRYAAKDVAPRIVVAAVAANASLLLVGQAINLSNAFSGALLGQGVSPAGATSVMRELVLTPLATGGIFLILLGLVVAVLAVVLLAIYIVRVALLVLLVAAAPLALICHALPQTEGLARLWWRATAACLAVQVGQSLVLIAALRVFFAPDGHAALGLSTTGGLVDVLVACCLLWVLIRIPTWAARAVFSGSGYRPSTAARVVRDVVVYKALRAGAAALG
jgi:hypothetical protein